MTKKISFGIEKQRFTRRYTSEGPDGMPMLMDNQPNPNYRKPKLTIADPKIADAGQTLKINYWANDAADLPALLERHMEHQEAIAEYHRQRNQGESKDESKAA